ncbi:MAG: MOSC domain-containing protein [Pseudomonadota bacterium]
MDGALATLTSTHARPGTVQWIGVRPARRVPVRRVGAAEITLHGLADDRRERPGKRAVTLIQWEHLAVIAALVGRDEIDPALLRRNVAIAGANLLGLRKTRFRLGEAVLQGTGLCAPCSRMEDALGSGGYTAVRGHGGITAEVLEPGRISEGDLLAPVDAAIEGGRP